MRHSQSRCSSSASGRSTPPPRKLDAHFTLPFILRRYIDAVLFSLAVLVFANSYDGDYVFDDAESIVNNDDVRCSWSLDLFRHDFWGHAINDVNSHKSYRPLTVLSFR